MYRHAKGVGERRQAVDGEVPFAGLGILDESVIVAHLLGELSLRELQSISRGSNVRGDVGENGLGAAAHGSRTRSRPRPHLERTNCSCHNLFMERRPLILLVDDSPEVLRAFVRAARRFGVDVLTAL